MDLFYLCDLICNRLMYYRSLQVLLESLTVLFETLSHIVNTPFVVFLIFLLFLFVLILLLYAEFLIFLNIADILEVKPGDLLNLNLPSSYFNKDEKDENSDDK